ncbi:MAG TPA: sigma-54 dependent transcriptional regulator [Pyrinomonadaceae bacterium]|nr:sigma-54 dependent transcriptional regulator [Pyrinomonadaceae bacterium]
MGRTILIADSDQSVRQQLSQALRGWGYAPVEVATGPEVIKRLEQELPAAMLLDMNSSGDLAKEVLRQVKQRNSDVGVIVIAASILTDDIISALVSGGDDFITRPINFEELEIRIRSLIKTRDKHAEDARHNAARVAKFSFDQIIGRSPSMLETVRLARRVAESEVSSVLLQGESGTGKDLMAKAIHYASKHAEHPFVAINCAALPANLIESELFGHEKGAFTDAKSRKAGLLEQANCKGTVFLDEISELDINLQAKLLRVLEEGSFRRVGGLMDVPFRARVIAASNRDLRQESEAGRFRLDLYYRLAVIQIDIPRLTDRGDDVLLLAQHFIDGACNGRRHIAGLTSEAIRRFQRYHWPGNVRELRNVIERAMILEDGEMISARYLPLEIAPSSERVHTVSVIDADATIRLPHQGIPLDRVETSLIRQALAQTSGNQTRAADLLGLSRDQFRYRLKKLRGIESGATLTASAAA